MAAKPGSEAAHEEKLRELAGPDAQWIFTAPKKYPKLDPEVLDRQTRQGSVCLLNEASNRYLVYRHEDQVHALVTELAHGGYRRRYRKFSADSVAELVVQLPVA